MTFKKILGLLALACLTIIGLSACTPEKEPTWTYDKNKMLFPRTRCKCTSSFCN